MSTFKKSIVGASLAASVALTGVATTAATAAPAQAVNIQAAKTTDKTVKTKANIHSQRSGTSKITGTLAKGSAVKVLSTNGSWSKVSQGKKTGWVASKHLTTPAVKKATGTSKTTTAVNLRASGSTRSKIVTVVPKGATVTVKATKSGWSQVTYNKRTGWLSSKYLTNTATTSNKSTVKKVAPQKSVTSESTLRSKVISNAKSNLGVKYRWGGTSPKTGWDCSGYIQYVFKKSGVNIPRTKAWTGKKNVSKSVAKPADFVVSYGGGHVGIYDGKSKQYHAANPMTGTVHAPIWDKKAKFFKSF